MSHAAQLRALRADFDFSQQELGHWLGLSRAQVAGIEAERDPLPRHARPWLWALVPPVAEARQSVPAVVLPAIPLTGPAPLLARLAECCYQAQRLGLQLVTQQAQVNTLRARLAVGPHWQAALSPPDAAEAAHSPMARRRRWLARLLEAATDELEPATTAATLLAARCHAWQSEAIWLAAALAADAGA